MLWGLHSEREDSEEMAALSSAAAKRSTLADAKPRHLVLSGYFTLPRCYFRLAAVEAAVLATLCLSLIFSDGLDARAADSTLTCAKLSFGR